MKFHGKLQVFPPPPGIDDVIHRIAGRDALGLRDLSDALGAESAFGVDVDHLDDEGTVVDQTSTGWW